MLLSVIIPVLADTAALERLLTALTPDSRFEVVVSAGDGDPRLDELAARRADTRVVRASRGRGTQMNAGARVARGEWLLFLHADSILPAAWLDVFSRTIGSGVGGWFGFRLDHPAWQARLIEWGVRWRVRFFTLPYGDQGIFCRRDVFAALGGYREIPLMEDVDFMRRLCGAGTLVELPVALTTSARRWERDGWARRSLRNAAVLGLYFVGVSPRRLVGLYERVRPSRRA
jgi:rSAM/selenodomain-associated transferase 2